MMRSSWEGERHHLHQDYGAQALALPRTFSESHWDNGGERGIRTPDTAFRPYNDLANRRLQPLGHLSGEGLSVSNTNEKNGALWRIRTTDLLIRSQMLYPAELRARTSLERYQIH